MKIVNNISDLAPRALEEVSSHIQREYTSWDYYCIGIIVLSILGTILIGIKMVLKAKKSNDDNIKEISVGVMNPIKTDLEITKAAFRKEFKLLNIKMEAGNKNTEKITQELTTLNISMAKLATAVEFIIRDKEEK